MTQSPQMPNFQLHKGNYTTIGVALTDYDGNPDVTTAITVVQSGTPLVVEPVSSGPANRDFYVSVAGGSTVSFTTTVTLVANIPATGTGIGGPVVQKSVAHVLDAVVPVDHRSAVPISPTAESPLPHP